MNTWLAVLLLAGGTLEGQDPPPRKIVLIAGPLDAHPRDTHEYEKTVILLKHGLETAPGLGKLRVELHFGGWPADPATLDDADTIFLTSTAPHKRLEKHPTSLRRDPRYADQEVTLSHFEAGSG